MNILRRILWLCPLLVLVITQAAWAQRAATPITAENAAQLTQIERIGNGTPRAMVLTSDGNRLAVATTLGVWVITLHRFDPSLETQEPGLPEDEERWESEMRLLEGQGGARSVTFSLDKAKVAAGGEDGSVMVWRAGSGTVVERLEAHLYPVTALTWSGSLLASGDQSGVVRLWNTMTWSETRVLQMADPIRQLLYHPAATQLTVFSGDQAITWDIAGGVLYQTGAPPDLRYAPNASMGERQAIYTASSGQIEIWDKSERILALDGFFGEMGMVGFTEDGRVRAAEIAPETIWSPETGDISSAPLDPATVTSPDGSQEASFGNDGVIHLIDSATGEEIAALHGHIRAIKVVAFSPDGRLLASASNDGTIGIWDATVTEDSGALVMLSGHHSGVTSVAFNAEGTLLASAGYDGTVRLWGIHRTGD